MKATARFIVLLMLAPSLVVSVAASAEPAQPSTALVAWLQQHTQRYGIPGASVAVMKNYRIEWAQGFGLRNKESKTAVTRDTLFQAASVSKAFTATAAMIAFDRTKLSIDADINDVFRSFHPYPDVGPWLLPNEYHPARPVTLRLLLSHAGGTNDFHYSGYRYGYYDEPPHSIERIPTMHEELDGLPPANTPPIAVSKERAPGAYWDYSPAGFTVVQAALMDIYDAPFSTIMDNLLLSPLQMRDSTFVQPTPQVLVSRVAVPYLTDGRRLSDGPRVFNTEASGGLTTRPTDLAKFVIAFQRALAGEAQGGITPSIAAQMMQRQNRPVWKCSPPATDSGKRFCEAPDGLGFDVNLTKRFEHQPDGEPTGGYFAHTGFNSGYLSLMMGSKSGGNGIVIMINVSPEDMSTSQIPEYTFLTDLVARVAEEEGWT